MAKFEIEMDITGFKLKIKADRAEDLPNISENLSQQMSGLLTGPSDVIEQRAPKPVDARVTTSSNGDEEEKTKKKGIRRKSNSSSDTAVSAPLAWTHDAAKWGTPKQGTWTATQKILWILYVISKEKDMTEVAGPVIAATFNEKFKQFGPLHRQNMPRDLGSLKTKSPSQVMDNPAKSPATWYLTESGIKEAEKLVIDAKGGAATQAA
jgi:hypothetical protein